MIRRRDAFHVVFGVLLAALLVGCDGQGTGENASSFSVDVRVEREDGSPVQGADVAVRPCYSFGCGPGQPSSSARGGAHSKSAELFSWSVQLKDRTTALLE
jgi:hypothetical protein